MPDRHEEERVLILSRLQDAEQEATDKLNEQRQAYEDRLKVDSDKAIPKGPSPHDEVG
jgi:hypothetical protein